MFSRYYVRGRKKLVKQLSGIYVNNKKIGFIIISFNAFLVGIFVYAVNGKTDERCLNFIINDHIEDNWCFTY